VCVGKEEEKERERERERADKNRSSLPFFLFFSSDLPMAERMAAAVSMPGASALTAPVVCTAGRLMPVTLALDMVKRDEDRARERGGK
jgi:hypothetical protein